MTIASEHVLPFSVSLRITEPADNPGGISLGQSVVVAGGPTRGSVAVTKFQVSFSANGIPQLVVWVADPNTRVAIGDDITLTITVNASATYGNKASQYLGTGSYTLFRGSVLDYGPGASQVGSVQLQVMAQGRLADLNTGTVKFSKIMPRTWQDLDIPNPLRNKQRGFSYLREQEFINEPAREMVRSLGESITTDTSTEDTESTLGKFLEDNFGGLNTRAATALLDLGIPPDLTFNTDIQAAGGGKQAMPKSIFQYIDRIFANDWAQQSILGRLASASGQLGMAVLETGSGMALLPWTPFTQRSAVDHRITAGEYSSFSPTRGPGTACSGTVLAAPGGVEKASNKSPTLVYGAYSRGANVRGLVNVREALPWLVYALPKESFNRVAARVENTGTGDTTPVGNRVAKFETWAMNWQSSAATVVCPFFRADIAPLNPVEVEVSESLAFYTGRTTDGIWLGGQDASRPRIFGSVDSVTISVDCNAGQASTAYNLVCVRSDVAQGEIDGDIESDGEHPVWNKRWRGIALYQDIYATVPRFRG